MCAMRISSLTTRLAVALMVSDPRPENPINTSLYSNLGNRAQSYMALIPRELDEVGNPRLTYRTTLENLVRALSNERCLIFLGAGASVDTALPSVPTGAQLAK